ncbi:MAG: hypothetical protein LBK29_00150 [Oscillospiraceae bacterium]|jgi:hypothetical protein|nr:hypothetical protein [Oscillospiraceae bacterium]
MKSIEKFENGTFLENEQKSEAACIVVRAYQTAVKYGSDNLIFGDTLWERNVPEISKILKNEGFDEITITNAGTELMDILACFNEQGYRTVGMTKVKTDKPSFENPDKKLIVNGIVLIRF